MVAVRSLWAVQVCQWRRQLQWGRVRGQLRMVDVFSGVSLRECVALVLFWADTGLVLIWANTSVGKKKGATRQRGLKLRLRDLGKIWVLALAPRKPAAASST